MRKEYDFGNAKRADEIAHLSKLRSERVEKERVTIILDKKLIDALKTKAAATGENYKTLINNALTRFVSSGNDGMGKLE